MNKKTIAYTLALALCAGTLAGCGDDKLSAESVITTDKRTPTPLDKWLDRYYVSTYNINFKYRYEDIEADMNYYTVPARYEMAVKMANLVRYSCLEAFDEVAGPDFMKANFPKLIYLTGNWEYRNNGSFILGTAEGGKKILLAGTNYINRFIQTAEDINTYYLKTVYHEFTHILNQTKPYSDDFKQITGTGYVSDKWEDFAEMFSTYVTSSPEKWEGWMKKAEKTDQRKTIEAKLENVRTYMRDAWNIDLDMLRKVYMRRETDIVKGKVDLSDISL